jgi:hypothetical protein
MIKDLTDITTDWNSHYDENENAKNKESRKVNNVVAIKIKDGFYRGSTINGTFQVANPENPLKTLRGETRVEVLVGWFGMKPKTIWPQVALRGSWEIHENYSGDVVLNLA